MIFPAINLHLLLGFSMAMLNNQMVYQSYMGYPLVNIQKTMERSTILNGKIHYKWIIYGITYGIIYGISMGTHM
jgi:hypothetical protein